MKPRRPNHSAIVETVVQTLLAEGSNLKAVILDDFKQRLQQTIRRMTEESKATAI